MRNYQKYNDENVEMHVNDDGFLEYIGTLDSEKYWERFSGNDTLSICLQ